MRLRDSVYALFIFTLLPLSVLHAASCWEGVRQQLESPDAINSIVVSDPAQPALDAKARDCLAELLHDPDTLNRALHVVTTSDGAANGSGALLRNLHLEFKTIEAPDASGASSAHLGLGYRFDKSIVTSPVGQACGESCVQALDFRFTAQGNLALQSDVNPRDFLEAHVTLGWFRSTGGAQRLDSRAQDRYSELAMNAAQIPAGREAELAAIHKQVSQLIANHLTNQLAYEFAADVALESDQQFRQKHWVYAARAALDFRGWAGLDAASWKSASTAAKLNLFDYPFALLRRLTGYADCDATDRAIGACFVPLGTSWPTISVAIGQVTPGSGETRTAIAGQSSYTRIASEVSFKTPIAKWQDKTVYVSANWRLYDELSASAAVRAADLAHYNYFVATAGPQRGLFASYSTGRLPFDHRDDQVYELGFRTVFN